VHTNTQDSGPRVDNEIKQEDWIHVLVFLMFVVMTTMSVMTWIHVGELRRQSSRSREDLQRIKQALRLSAPLLNPEKEKE
jgi:hypothetical protein